MYNLYRHYKGGYYLVLSEQVIDEHSGSEVVLYQSVKDNRVWVRKLSDFMSDAPVDNNPTGQKRRFQVVRDLDNPLTEIPTSTLLNELHKRSDNPYLIHSDTLNEKVWRTDYLVGTYDSYPTDGDNFVEDFDVKAVFSTMEEAKEFLGNSNNIRYQLLKRVFIKEDF